MKMGMIKKPNMEIIYKCDKCGDSTVRMCRGLTNLDCSCGGKYIKYYKYHHRIH